MKYKGFYIIAFLFLLTSCDNFLEYKDKDKVIPNKLAHYEELIFGEIIVKHWEDVFVNLPLMTDDVACYVKDQVETYDSDSREKYYGWYTWAVEPQHDFNGEDRQDKAWAFFYHKILMCNIVESEVNKLEDDLDGLKKRLLGEVQCIRAISYFYLVNLYGAPYESKEQAVTAMGIPINRETGIYEKYYTRSTLAEVYDEMEKDLLKARQNFQEGAVKNTIFRPNIHVANLFLSRIYLFQKRYEEAITYATEVITHSEASIQSMGNMINNKNFYNKGNTGIIFSWGTGEQGPIYSSNWDAGRFIVSTDLKSKYIPEDKRSTSFFDSYSGFSTKTTGDEIYRRAYRIEEAYLNRAEAYIELEKEWKKGIDDIHAIRQNRIEGDAWQTKAATLADAREAYRLERRLEFCFEDFRWFDMRRWGLGAEHRYENFRNNQSYQLFRLEPISPNYILPIPLDEQDINTHIEKPERVDCKVNEL